MINAIKVMEKSGKGRLISHRLFKLFIDSTYFSAELKKKDHCKINYNHDLLNEIRSEHEFSSLGFGSLDLEPDRPKPITAVVWD